jgi:hypothetical protein
MVVAIGWVEVGFATEPHLYGGERPGRWWFGVAVGWVEVGFATEPHLSFMEASELEDGGLL